MKIIGFVYKWTNTVNGKWYIGSHKGTTGDGYRHTSEIMRLAEKKHGIDSFTREILYNGDNFREKEAKMLCETDAANNTQSYNRSNMSGPTCFSKETLKKLSNASKGRTAWNKGMKTGSQSENHKHKRSEAMRGKKQSEEHIRKRSEARIGQVRGPQSKEAKQNISVALSGRRLSESHKSKLRKPQKTITCQYCRTTGGISNMKRWHFDNCKRKNNKNDH